MTFLTIADGVNITMTRVEFNCLLLTMGRLAGAALKAGDQKTFWAGMRLVNAINATNPNFTPYEIPEEKSI